MNEAYITTITGMNYYKGLRVLVRSMKRTNTAIPLYVMLPEDADASLRRAVEKLDVSIIECPHIQLPEADQRENTIAHWNQTFFKLNIFRLTQFRKLVYIDADMLVLRNIDHLFRFPSISGTTGGKAAHPEWQECNSGLLVIEPEQALFDQMIACIGPAIQRRKAMGRGYGDQDVLNQYYPNFHAEPDHNFGEAHNAECPHLDALMQKEGFHDFSGIYVLHYIGVNKIWNNSLLKNLRIIRGCFLDHKPFEAKAYLLYLRHLYF